MNIIFSHVYFIIVRVIVFNYIWNIFINVVGFRFLNKNRRGWWKLFQKFNNAYYNTLLYVKITIYYIQMRIDRYKFKFVNLRLNPSEKMIKKK